MNQSTENAEQVGERLRFIDQTDTAKPKKGYKALLSIHSGRRGAYFGNSVRSFRRIKKKLKLNHTRCLINIGCDSTIERHASCLDLGACATKDANGRPLGPKKRVTRDCPD